MMKIPYRGKYEIYLDILSECNDVEGTKKTRIMYASRVSYFQLQQYLGDLIKRGMIEQKAENKETKYFLTGRGRHTMQLLTEIGKIFKDGSQKLQS